ncbi:PP2C family protein-serine/threonine phosphatase [Streptomyces sp. NPDC006393]|uniref:PP2C family protein-serine/threonine phosphatase n=1 Tax=Streptomyces sp. NPDC006393 TaxID=3156763 RepID=UPI0033DBADA4
MVKEPVGVGDGIGDSTGTGLTGGRLEALDRLLAEQRDEIARYAAEHSVPAREPGTGPCPPRPGPPPVPPAPELLDALPIAVMVVLPVFDERGEVTDFCYVGQNAATLEHSARHVPPGILPPWTGRVPLFQRFPNMADTPVPRLLAEAQRTGRAQGPEPAEWSLAGPDGLVVRMSSDVRVTPCGGLLLLTWERGQKTRMEEAAQQLVRVCWVEWNLGDGSVEPSSGLRDVLGLPASQPLPGLLDLGRMVAPVSLLPLYAVIHDVLLRERVAECDLQFVRPSERIVRLVAEPVRPEDGPVWTVRAVLHDVTDDRYSRSLAERALREARTQRQRADTVAEVAERLRDAVLPRFPAELALHGIEAAVVYRPEPNAARVGGDWYKTRILPSGQVLIALGDARGHGLDAVTLMAKLRYALAGLAFTGELVEQLTGWLNLVACDDGDESTATAIIGRYHPDRGMLRWTCAGHPLPVLLRERRARLLDPPPGGPGTPLGVLPGEKYEAAETLLYPGDVVLLYSDGLIERRGSDLDRDSCHLLEAADGCARGGIPPGDQALDAYVQRLVHQLTGPHPQDDATVLAIRLTDGDIGGW